MINLLPIKNTVPLYSDYIREVIKHGIRAKKRSNMRYQLSGKSRRMSNILMASSFSSVIPQIRLSTFLWRLDTTLAYFWGPNIRPLTTSGLCEWVNQIPEKPEVTLSLILPHPSHSLSPSLPSCCFAGAVPSPLACNPPSSSSAQCQLFRLRCLSACGSLSPVSSLYPGEKVFSRPTECIPSPIHRDLSTPSGIF